VTDRTVADPPVRYLAEPVPAPVSRLGEGCTWDADAGRLVWVDILGAAVHLRAADGATATVPLPRLVGTVVPAPDGRLLVGTTLGLELLDPATGALETVAEVEAGDGRRRMNDGKCDAAGRVYAGTLPRDDVEPPRTSEEAWTGVLHRLDRDRTTRPLLTGLGCPNGLAWPSPDRMWFIDSDARALTLYRVDPATGDLTGVEQVVDTSAFEGVPDGCTLDGEGCLWVAFWDGGVVRRFAPDGTVLAVVEVPTPQVTSCCFGDDDLGTLYVTTAGNGPQLGRPGAGELYRCRPGVPGAGHHRWRG
jgi:sugar lactone lactonase YvrE